MDIIKTAANILGKTGLILSKNAPKIMLATGIACVGTGTVLACRSTLKTRDELSVRYKEIDMASENNEDRSKLMALETFGVGLRNFALPVSLIGGGLALIVKGHSIQEKRLAGAIAAYNALDAGFRQYRARVVEKEGSETDKAYMYGVEDATVEEIYTDEETGKEKKRKVHCETIDPDELSVYSRCFDQFNSDEWRNDPIYNHAFLKGVQEVFNQILQTKGYVFLNDVYRELGFREVPAGQAVGWIKGLGDDFIDFGIYDARNRKALEFRNGAENCIWLDFNVDGIIWDKI